MMDKHDKEARDFRKKIIEKTKGQCNTEVIPTSTCMLLFGKMCYSLGRVDGTKELGEEIKNKLGGLNIFKKRGGPGG